MFHFFTLQVRDVSISLQRLSPRDLKRWIAESPAAREDGGATSPKQSKRTESPKRRQQRQQQEQVVSQVVTPRRLRSRGRRGENGKDATPKNAQKNKEAVKSKSPSEEKKKSSVAASAKPARVTRSRARRALEPPEEEKGNEDNEDDDDSVPVVNVYAANDLELVLVASEEADDDDDEEDECGTAPNSEQVSKHFFDFPSFEFTLIAFVFCFLFLSRKCLSAQARAGERRATTPPRRRPGFPRRPLRVGWRRAATRRTRYNLSFKRNKAFFQAIFFSRFTPPARAPRPKATVSRPAPRDRCSSVLKIPEV